MKQVQNVINDRVMNKTLSDYISSNLQQMKTERGYYEDRWIEACQFFKHRTRKSYGETHIKDIEPIPLAGTFHIQCMQTTIDGFASQLLSPATRWFRFHILGKAFSTESDIPFSKDWTEQVENIQNHVYDNSPSRFYSNTLLALKDSFVLGISYEIIADDVRNNQIVFECYNPWECYARHNSNKIVDTVYREFSLTAVQAEQKWGRENLPQSIQEKIDNGDGWDLCTFVNAIYPDEQNIDGFGNPFSVTPKPFASVYYYEGGKEDNRVFAVSGYDTFPIAVHRWEVEGNEDYGSSPVLKHIETFKKYVQDERMKTITVQKLVDPQMTAPLSMRDRLSNRPGARLYYNSKDEGMPEYLQIKADLNSILTTIEAEKQDIMRLLYTDLFKILMMQDRERTAYEVQQLKGEGMALLSAVVGNIQVEKLVPIIKRTYTILNRMGALPDMPTELEKAYKQGRVKIELDGPLIQTMQKYTKLNGLVNGLSGVQGIIATFPDAKANFDGDEYARQLASAIGLPERIIREKYEVEQIHKQQAQLMQQQQQQQQQLQGSQALKNLGVDASQMSEGA